MRIYLCARLTSFFALKPKIILEHLHNDTGKVYDFYNVFFLKLSKTSADKKISDFTHKIWCSPKAFIS